MPYDPETWVHKYAAWRGTLLDPGETLDTYKDHGLPVTHAAL